MTSSAPAKLHSYLEQTVKQNASDLHLSPGHPPILRIARQLVPMPNQAVFSESDVKELAEALMNEQQQELLEKDKSVDFSYRFQEKARFRVNVFYQKGTISVALRLVPSKIRTLEELELPPILHRFTEISQGFVIVAGPSSHGKSTTLAALLDEINHTRAAHIITIEDPMEYVFEPDQSIIDQREVYRDTLSFSHALRATFRQDPDVIMVGEMRDPETIATAITAAETGHLVFATLHTNSAAQTIHRIVDTFPAGQQKQIQAQLASTLSGVISQRLIPQIKGGLVPAIEIMFSTPAIGNLIRENKIHEIPFVIETSSGIGMVSLNRSLTALVRARKISMQDALAYSADPMELRNLIGGMGSMKK